jgi:putative exosortase-associated protein (TIGR04073 family)
MKYIGIIVFCLIFPLFLIADSQDDGTKKNVVRYDFVEPDNSNFPVSGESLVSHAGRKFVRGTVNVLTGVGEIPRQMVISYREEGPAFFIPVGLFTGLFMTVVRTTYGAVEIATFMAPLEGTYNSLIVPAYVWGSTEYKVEVEIEKEPGQ